MTALFIRKYVHLSEKFYIQFVFYIYDIYILYLVYFDPVELVNMEAFKNWTCHGQCRRGFSSLLPNPKRRAP